MIEYIKIQGFKSIKNLEIELKPINILIGANGSGKSNFISFFRLLYFGRKTTESLYGKVIFSEDNIHNNAYYFSLLQDNTGGMFIGTEGSGYRVSYDDDIHNYFHKSNLSESKLIDSTQHKRHRILNNYLASFRIFHFHDTSKTSFLRKRCDISDNSYLKADGRNLPAMLYLLKEKQ